MGIPIAKIAAIPAALASIIQTEVLQRKLVRDDVDLLGVAMGLLEEWKSTCGGSDLISIDQIRAVAKPQKWLTEKGSLAQRELLLRNVDARFKTLINACSAPSSGSWTHIPDGV